ncbi:hypothetical protein [Algoriphagus sp. AK58]|uniref:hypothetical protein n=1 Tax=Algoriphagus sp. AK58 TaxID=1406877 RepID=UPI0016507FA2|nr:hypothetical protein [Algoriphagus sp. AK58]
MEERHTKVLGKIFDAGPEGFQGSMSAKKYMSITQVSNATTTRYLQYLYERGMLTKSGQGVGAVCVELFFVKNNNEKHFWLASKRWVSISFGSGFHI